MDTRDYSLLCDYTQRRIIDIAMRWERSLSVRIQVRKDNNKLVFLCPDPNVHGAAYAAVAEPVIVTHVQDALF